MQTLKLAKATFWCLRGNAAALEWSRRCEVSFATVGLDGGCAGSAEMAATRAVSRFGGNDDDVPRINPEVGTM